MTDVMTTDPRTGLQAPTSIDETTPSALAEIGDSAAVAGKGFAATTAEQRVALLSQIADRIRRDSPQLVAAAESETGLASGRLASEVERAAGQFLLFADVVRDGAYLEAMIDEAAGEALPDVRRLLVPVGPVAVFGASNFPFAFSVLGGDTASALAAGCPVIVKAHPAHPLTSRLSGELLRDACHEVLGARDIVQLVYGFDAGLGLVKHPAVRAATLTGSLRAAAGIQHAIDERDAPIPFFAELGSVNPLIVFAGAAATRGAEIASGLARSFTGSGGQLCTKPGYAFIPEGGDGDDLVAALVDEVSSAGSSVLLSETIRDGFTAGVEALSRSAEILAVAGDRDKGAVDGFRVNPTLLQIRALDVDSAGVDECFGPLLVVVRYAAAADLEQALARFPGSLTLTLHVGEGDRQHAEAVLDAMTDRTGRVIFNGFPTGVRVGWAQHHGGPWPATNSQHTSVGVTAIRRFLRPIAYQNAPEWALPPELRDDAVGVWRRRNGVLEQT